ncbi:YtrH family sporulation protein [Bacillus marinisedimentorum]|uniref:YtrH family sporulation protein n=1 Tax=Bacillus marinisedimentorum TaxID=1821260 RepID=UPI0008729B2F|nr:YtrH family sporulation protein [Bacillus marinisedimentorum]
MEERFIASLINCYFIALGVILGGAVIGGIGAFIIGTQPPLTMISRLAGSLKIWAIVAAIGGTFDVINNFERGIFEGATTDIIKQVLLIISAMGGVQSGSLLIQWLTQEHTT